MYFYNKIDFLNFFSDLLAPFNDLFFENCLRYNVNTTYVVYSSSLFNFVFLKSIDKFLC
jgi:hypothetical protein